MNQKVQYKVLNASSKGSFIISPAGHFDYLKYESRYSVDWNVS